MIKSRALPILYQSICAAFCSIVLLSNIFSAKMAALPLFNLTIPAGLICYPMTFLLSDLVTEIFGAKRALLMVYVALGMSLFSYCLIAVVLALPPSNDGPFQAVLELSGLRIFSSLISYIASQIAGIQIYAAIKRWLGANRLWLKSNGSTFVSQILDTLLIDLIFLWWGLKMPMAQVAPIMLFSYAYKTIFSAACTPLFYLFVYMIRRQPKGALS